MNHGKFKGKGEEILASQKPNSLGEFSAETPDAGMTENRDDGNSETHQTETAEEPNPGPESGGSGRTVREEFRCPPELSERLNTYVFDQKKTRRSASKTDVVNAALELFLTQIGY
jgi:hypothetical protein